jgi:hypothetical protein
MTDYAYLRALLRALREMKAAAVEIPTGDLWCT